jgi:hypothetical protein
VTRNIQTTLRHAIRTTSSRARHATDTGAHRALRVLTKEELRRQLLALILAAVLVWYTFVVPSNAPPKQFASRTPDDGEYGGEVRQSNSSLVCDSTMETDVVSDSSVDELDWPEYIYVD